jgi:hypothetical protein
MMLLDDDDIITICGRGRIEGDEDVTAFSFQALTLPSVAAAKKSLLLAHRVTWDDLNIIYNAERKISKTGRGQKQSKKDDNFLGRLINSC